MPTFVIINTNTRTIELHNLPNYKDALKAAKLEPGQIDFGSIGHHRGFSITIMCYEFGLIQPNQTTYFRLGTQLFNGNAIIFAADIEGETVDFPFEVAEHWKTCPEFEWLSDANAAEAAIQSGRIIRPQSSINGQVVWAWNLKETKH